MSYNEERRPAGEPDGAENRNGALRRHSLPPAAHPVNSAEAQRARILAALRKGSLTTLEARSDLDVLHPAARVMELRRRGHESEGKPHRVANYLLRQEAADARS